METLLEKKQQNALTNIYYSFPSNKTQCKQMKRVNLRKSFVIWGRRRKKRVCV